MIIQRLNWDSDFFGIRIGRADIVSYSDSCNLAKQHDVLKDEYDLLYVNLNHGIEFTYSGAQLVDKKVVYKLITPTMYEMSPNIVLWDNNIGLTKDLLHLSLVSGKYSRFKLDENLPTGSYERLYTRWIEQSVNHIIATEVFCYMIDNVPRGLVTFNNQDGEGSIGLVAIHEDYQHRGIGSTMMKHVISYAQHSGCSIINVVTQNDNIPACNLYEKVGFEVDSITDVWHWWL